MSMLVCTTYSRTVGFPEELIQLGLKDWPDSVKKILLDFQMFELKLEEVEQKIASLSLRHPAGAAVRPTHV